MRRGNPYYSCVVPLNMVDEPHMIHFGGMLMQPGEENDYTIELFDDDAVIHWWDSVVSGYREKLISITSLKTGARWAFSSEYGVYVDTR